MSDNRRFRIFCVIADFTHECGLPEMDNIAQQRGFPLLVVSDNSTEFTSNVMLRWQQNQRVEWHYIAPGKPMQNDLIESFIGRLHAHRVCHPVRSRP